MELSALIAVLLGAFLAAIARRIVERFSPKSKTFVQDGGDESIPPVTVSSSATAGEISASIEQAIQLGQRVAASLQRMSGEVVGVRVLEINSADLVVTTPVGSSVAVEVRGGEWVISSEAVRRYLKENALVDRVVVVTGQDAPSYTSGVRDLMRSAKVQMVTIPRGVTQAEMDEKLRAAILSAPTDRQADGGLVH